MAPDPLQALARAHSPLAQDVGPFPEAQFLTCWWRHLGDGELLVAGDDGSCLPLVRRGGELRGAGSADVTDYRSPLGTDLGVIADDLTALVTEGHSLRLESLPEEAARPLSTEMRRRGISLSFRPSEPTYVLRAMVGGDPYSGLSSRQAHELRRKVRRYTEQVGRPVVRVWRRDSDAFGRFVELHRRSSGLKGAFLDERRTAFFECLWRSPGWRLDELVGDGRSVAFVFGFEAGSVHYLYNSAYDSTYGALSPGSVLFAQVIARGVENGLRSFDFLKGAEPYKTRLGAAPRRLFELVVD